MDSPRSRDDLVAAMRQQIRLLSKAAAEFDRGDEDEYVNISIRLRVLFHDGQWGPSLLRLLHQERIKLSSTAVRWSPTAGFVASLTDMTIGVQPRVAEFTARKGKGGRAREVSFDSWWNKELVYVIQGKGIRVTRRNLVTAAANRDGGAHVAATHDAAYQFLLEGAGWSITYRPDHGPVEMVPIKNAHKAALRQIAYEVCNSLQLLAIK